MILLKKYNQEEMVFINNRLLMEIQLNKKKIKNSITIKYF